MGRHMNIETWLLKVMSQEEGRDQISAITLSLAVGEQFNKYTEIHAVRFGNKIWEVDELAKEFRERAEIYVQDLFGSYLFALHPFFGKDTEPGPRHTFRASGGNDESGVMPEASNDKGITSQLMRVLDTNSQMAWRAQAAIGEQLMRVSEFHVDVIARQHRQLMEQHELIAGFFKEKNAQNHEAKMKELESERINNLITKAGNLAPAFIEALTGVKALPEPTVENSLLEQMAEELMNDPEPTKVQEKVKILASLFSQETATMLGQKLMKIVLEKRKEKAKLSLVKDEKKDATHD